MQRVVTSTTASKDSLYIAHESALSIFPTRAKSNGVFDWIQTREPRQLNNEIGNERHWNISTAQNSSPELSSDGSLLAIKKLSNMPARNLADMNNSAADSNRASDRNLGASNNGSCWRLSGSGQLIDGSEWDLAQDIARLNLGPADDLADDVHGQLMAPAQSKLATATVVQFNEASPLESASEASLDSSPQHSDHQISPSHSRVSSTDSHESAMSSASHTLRGPPQLKIATTGETRERPHSFSGGLSTADLRRLKQAGEEPSGPVQAGGSALPAHQWSSSYYRERLGDKPFSPVQPTYPSLSNSGAFGRGQQYDYRPQQGPTNGALQAEYAPNQPGFFPPTRGIPGASQQHFVQPRHSDGAPATAYRASQRNFPPQPLLPNHTGLGYGPSGHVQHLSLGTAQQLYDLVAPDHPAVTRVQQQHNVFRATHQHSASDPASLRDAAALALLSNQVFGPAASGLYPSGLTPPAVGLFPSQFYGPPDGYGADVGQVANRLQPQYSGQYGAVSNHSIGLQNNAANPGTQTPGGGPSANNRKLGLYKTELCRSWEEKGTCRYGTKCQFAHGEDELRNVPRHPKYKTEICRTFWVSGACPYGKRCCFIHTELPVSGITPGTDGAPPLSATATSRERSNSDPNEASNSLLARIQRKNEATPVEVSPSGSFFNERPLARSLRVDTSVPNNVSKQNKSAYPTFASNALMLSNPEQTTIKSPVPLTAGPDFGRHNAARLDIVGLNQRLNKASSANPSSRHSFNGTDVDLDFTSPSTPSATNPVTSFAMSPNERVSGSNAVPRSHHVRSGSAGNWGSVGRSSNLTGAPSYPQSSEGSDVSNMPWSTSELSVGSTRLTDNWI